MGYTCDDHYVRADVFTASGKWKYTVSLEYSNSREDYQDFRTEDQARKALARATEAGTSGVTFREIPISWFMIVLEPYSANSYPITVYGKE